MTSSLMIVTATVTSMNVTIFTDQRNNNHRFDVGDLDNMVIKNVLSGERPGVHQELPGLLPQQPHHRIAW